MTARTLSLLARLAVAIACLHAMAPTTSYADTYPSRPIKIVIAFPPGTPPDITSRRLGETLSPLLGQPIIIENKGGAAGSIGTEAVAKSPPDGYTLTAGTNGTHVFNLHLYKALPYHPLNDFAPVTRLVIGSFNTLLVHPSFPGNSVAEFIAVAKARAGQGKPLTFGSGGVGTIAHLSIELLKRAMGIQAVHIPYKGSSQVITDLVGGHIDFMSGGPPVALPQIAAKKLKAIAIDAPKRSPSLPDVQTLMEVGIDKAEVQAWIGLFAPAKTPPDVVARLHQAVVAAISGDQIRADLDRVGLTVATDPTPEAFRKLIAEEIAKWEVVIRDAGIAPQ